MSERLLVSDACCALCVCVGCVLGVCENREGEREKVCTTQPTQLTMKGTALSSWSCAGGNMLVAIVVILW